MTAQSAIGKKASFRRKNKGENKDEGLHKDDTGTGGAVDEETDVNACYAGKNRTADGDELHLVETICEQKPDAARGDQHGDDEDDADGLERSDDGQRQQGKHHVIQHRSIQPHATGVTGIEAKKEKVFSHGQGDGESDPSDECSLDNLCARNAEEATEKDVVKVLIAVNFGEKDETKREKTGKNDSHNGVFLDSAVALDKSGADSAEQPGKERADGQRDAHHVGQDDAR